MRWTTDPGAIPGEPFDYLDIPVGADGEIGEAKAVIVEIETAGGSRWEARTSRKAIQENWRTVGRTTSQACCNVFESTEQQEKSLCRAGAYSD
jgi:hypothetical protein